MNKVPEGQFGQTPKHCQCEEFWGWRSIVSKSPEGSDEA